MTAFKNFFDFYINSSVHVALAIVAMSFVTYLEFDIPLDLNVLSFIGFASITGYNFVKYFGLAKFHHRSLSKKLKSIQIFSFLCFLVMCYFAFRLNEAALVAILIYGIITFLYAIPLLPNRFFIDQKKKLRSISGLKIYIIALVWSGVTVGLPIINAEFGIHDDVIVSAIQRLLFVILLMLPFEIRDLNFDSLKLATIPQQIGIRRTKFLGMLLSVVILSLEYFKDNLNFSYSISLVIVLLSQILFLKFSSKEQGPYYSSFWVESLPIWWILLLLMFS